MARKSPRLAGLRLQALAKLLDTPVAGKRLAEALMRQMLLRELDHRDLPDAEIRPVIGFRAAPRRHDV